MKDTGDWAGLARQGRFSQAEAAMLAATDRGEGMFPLNEERAWFYETWTDTLVDPNEKRIKYEAAVHNWEMWAACSTSGGEGTARMSEVHRVEEKIRALRGSL